MIFQDAAEGSAVEAVLDWELSTLGHPATDLSLTCLPYHTPAHLPVLGGFKGKDGDAADRAALEAAGVPTEQAFVDAYVEKTGHSGVREHLDYYYAFACFRAAGILQGVYARSLKGQASAANANAVGQLAGLMAELGCGHAKRYEAQPGRLARAAGAGGAFAATAPAQAPARSFAAAAAAAAPKPTPADVAAFMKAHVFPAEAAVMAHS